MVLFSCEIVPFVFISDTCCKLMVLLSKRAISKSVAFREVIVLLCPVRVTLKFSYSADVEAEVNGAVLSRLFKLLMEITQKIATPREMDAMAIATTLRIKQDARVAAAGEAFAFLSSGAACSALACQAVLKR